MVRLALILLLTTSLHAKTYLISETTSEIGKALQTSLIQEGHEIVPPGSETTLDGLILITPRPKNSPTLFPSEKQWLTLFEECFTTPLELINTSLTLFSDRGSIIIISQFPSHPISNVLHSMWSAEVTSLKQTLAPLQIRVTFLSEEKASSLICQTLTSLENML